MTMILFYLTAAAASQLACDNWIQRKCEQFVSQDMAHDEK